MTRQIVRRSSLHRYVLFGAPFKLTRQLTGVLVASSLVVPCLAHAQKGKVIPLIGGSAVISVTPQGGSTSAPGSTTTSYTFGLQNTGTGSASVTFTASCSGALSSCSASPSSATMAANSTRTVVVTYNTASTGTGELTLDATWPTANDAQGWVTVTLPPPPEQPLTVSAPSGPVQDEINSSVTRAFTVHNPNASSESYTWSATCSGVTSCSGQAGTVGVAANSSASVNVAYNTGAASGGSGTISFTAGDAAGNASAALSVITNDYTPGVVPSSGEFGSLVIGQSVVDTFAVRNQGNQEAIYSVSASCDGAITTTCSLANSMQATNGVDLLPGETALVPVHWQASGSATTSHVSLTATFSNAHGTWSNTGTRTLTSSTWQPTITANGPPAGGFAPDAIGLIQSFTVTNTGNTSATYSFTVSCVDGVGEGAVPASCVVVTPGPGSIAANGGTGTVQVRFNSGDAGTTSTMTLTATASPYSGSGSASISVNQVPPSLTTIAASVADYNGVGVTRAFVLHNPNRLAESYSWSIVCHGAASCTPSSGSTAVPASDSVSLTAPYTPSGAPNATGAIVATASSSVGSVTDSISMRIRSYAAVVTAVGSPATPAAGASGSASFTVKNVGSDSMSYAITASCDNTAATQCQAPATPVSIMPSQQIAVTVSYTAGANLTSGGVLLRALPNGGSAYSDSAMFAVNVHTPTVFTVNTSFMNNDDQDMSLCAASCFAMTASRSTVPYYTLDTPRSVTLAYNGDRAFPRPFVYADVSVTSPPAPLQAYHLEVWRNGARLHFTNTDSILVFQPPATPGTTYRLAGQIDMSSYATGAYPVQVIVTALYSNGGSDVSTTNTQLLVVNTQSSSVAKGWTVAGIPRLYLQSDSSAVITDGAGSALYFVKGSGGYTAPSGDFTTLTTSSNGGWVRTSLDNTKIWFGPSGLADSVTDRLGYNTQFAYDASQRLVKIYDPFLIRKFGAAAATVLTYGTTGLASIQEANPVPASGRITNVQVDASGLLRSVIDPAGIDTTTYGYDTSLRLNAITNSSGHTTTYSYGSSWKLSQVTAPAVPIDAGGGATTMQQPATLIQPWQAVGVPTAVTGGTAAPPVRPDTIVARVTDANGSTASFTVNRWGQPMSSTDPLGNVTAYQRTGVFATTQSINDGTVSEGVNQYTYDGAFLTMAHQAGSESVNYHYGVAAQIDSTWGSGTVFQKRFLKPDGRADSVEYDHNTNRVTRYTYDTTTKAVASVTDPAGHTTSYSYDPTFGNLTETIAPGGRYQTSHFDAYGRDTVTLAPGVGAHYTRFDNLNRAVFDSVAGNTGATRMNYPHDTLVVTDAKGQVYRTDMNALGWSTAQHHPDGTLAPITNRYDKDGQLTSTTNRRGQTTILTYDALGRVRSRNDPVSGVTSFSYSPGGFTRVASNATVKDSSTSRLFCYTGQNSTSDACNADTTVVTMVGGVNTGAHYTMGSATPGAFNAMTSQGDDDGFTQFESKFTRNSLGEPDSVTLGPLTMKYVYDQYNGLLTTTTLPNGSTRTDQYTTNNEPYNWTYSDTTINPLYRRSYRVDLLGRVTSEQMGYPYSSLANSYQLNREAAYDSLGHVSQVNWSYQSCTAWPGSNPDSLSADQGWRDICSPSAVFSESYSYDAVGNRTDAGAGYNPGNRLTSVSWAMYVYDADGNVISRTNTANNQLMQFYWDAGNQLDSVKVSGGGFPSERVDYRYDPYGRLVLRTATDSTPSTGRLYLYGAGSNSSNITKEVDLVSGNTTEYQYAGIDHPTMSVTRNSAGTVLQSRTYMMDGLGNVVGSALDGSTGAAIIYDSWGNVVTDSTAFMRLGRLRFGFKGMLYDETTGLYNARARWYQPDVGRFMSEDPLGLSAGINQYVFAADDPINNSDPSGALVTDAQGSTCSINASECGEPLQMPGSSSYSAGDYGGGVSFAGGWNPNLPNGIQLKNSKVNYWGVNAILRAAVEAAAEGLDVTFLISSGDDQHNPPSLHAFGLAIDIAAVNGMHFNAMNPDAASGLAFDLGEMILQFIPSQDWREMIGPGFVLGFNGKTYSDEGYMTLLAAHSGANAHLHIGIRIP
jgi:RHS repeat-associated protein